MSIRAASTGYSVFMLIPETLVYHNELPLSARRQRQMYIRKIIAPQTPESPFVLPGGEHANGNHWNTFVNILPLTAASTEVHTLAIAPRTWCPLTSEQNPQDACEPYPGKP